MDIYYAIGQKKQAPVPAVEMISMLERGDVTEETMGWHRGCDSWMPLKELPALHGFFTGQFGRKNEEEPFDEDITEMLIPPSDAKVPGQQERVLEAPRDEVSRCVEIPAPSLRFYARVFDLIIYLLIYFAFLRTTFDHFDVKFFNPLAWLPFVILETVCLMIWGTTPGKALLGMHVVMMDGGKPGFKRLLIRSFYVIFFGMGLVTTVFTPVLLGLSWWWTKKNVLTPWDQRLSTLVEIHRKVAFPRIILLLVITFALLQGIGLLAEPWLPEIEAAGQEYSRMMNQSR